MYSNSINLEVHIGGDLGQNDHEGQEKNRINKAIQRRGIVPSMQV